MSHYEIFVATLLSSWGIATVAFQFDYPRLRRWSYRDCFGLLPLWTFFAPSPGQTDYHLLYRDQIGDNEASQWSEIPLTEPRKVYSGFWNPEKRSKKVLSDVVQMLIEYSSALHGTPRDLVLSTPYVLVLNVVMSEPKSMDARRRMFVIAQSHGFLHTAEPQPVVRSALHAFS